MNSSIMHWGKRRLMLRASVSLAAFALTAPAIAADMVVKAPAPVTDRGELRAFVEGGAFWSDGSSVPYTVRGFELLGAFPVLGLAGNGPNGNAGLRPNVGWDAAVGLDHRVAGTPWHVNMQVRWGVARGSDTPIGASFNQTSTQFQDCRNPPTGIVTSDTRSARGTSFTSADLKESHWQADFGVGYDYIPRLMQINFGLRVADVRATSTATTNTSATTSRTFQLNVADPLSLIDTDISLATATNFTSERRSFFGVGPRVGLEGSVPLGGQWTFDYSGDAAVLLGNSKITSASIGGASISSTLTTVVGGVVLATQTSAFSQPTLSNTAWSSSNMVFNFDIQGGISWWFSPTSKLGLSYRLDAFVDTLRAAPGGGHLSRYYHGPKLTLTSSF